MQEIKSAGSAAMTSAGLAAFREALASAQQLHSTTSLDLAVARHQELLTVDHYSRWDNGWLLKRLNKKKFAALKKFADESMARRCELEEQLELSKLHTQFDMPDSVVQAFSRLSDDFASCARSQCIWDNVAHRAANQIAERTQAHRVIDRKPVRFHLGQCRVIQTEMVVPHLENANGGDIYFYPGFLLYSASPENYALIEYQDVKLSVSRMGFQEQQQLPTDAKQIGLTWAKTNKDGSPDRRFRENYQIPIMEYALLVLKSRSGLNEEYLLSNVEAAESFESAWKALRAAVLSGAKQEL